jgi:hypothetical protein
VSIEVGTAVGPADVLHRLALAVECVDAQTRARPRTAVRIGREVGPRFRPGDHERDWPCLDLDAPGTARALLRLDARTPTRLRLRIADPRRRYVARRFDLPLWTLAEIVAADERGDPVPGRSRLLQPWLLPGSGAALSRGLTTVRGTVLDDQDRPVRWARLTALGQGQVPVPVGWAHADDRGEFVLVVEHTGTLPPPAPSTLRVTLVVRAAHPAAAVDPDDSYSDLVVEAVTRSAAPPGPGELANNILRGRAVPPGYVTSTAVQPTIDAPVGQELALPAPVRFTV